ncbi:FUSC family protein [Luteimonas sp. A611]
MTRPLPEWIWPERLGRMDVEAAIRASFCVVVPLALLLALGRSDLIVYVAFPAFTSLYGRGERYRDRVVTLAVAGFCLLGVVAAATLASVAMWNGWQVTLMLAALAAAGVVLSERMQWIPFGGTFFVFSFAVVASVPVEPAQVPARLLLSAATVALCWVVGMAGLLLRRAMATRLRRAVHLPAFAPLRPARRRPAAWTDVVVWWTAVEVAMGVVLAIVVVEALGFGHAYWAAVTVVACMPRPYSRHFAVKTGHRIIGTALGVLVAGLLLGLGLPAWVLVLAVGAFQFATELFVGRVYWLATVFITPLALVVGYLAQVSALAPLLVDRLVDTLIGGAVLLVVEFAGRPLAQRLLRRRGVPATR